MPRLASLASEGDLEQIYGSRPRGERRRIVRDHGYFSFTLTTKYANVTPVDTRS